MEAEEAVLEFVVGGELRVHEGVDPGGVVGFIAMTVGLVVHDLAGMDALLVIDLPEDDATVLGTAEAVAIRGGQHLALVQIACRDHGLTDGSRRPYHRALCRVYRPLSRCLYRESYVMYRRLSS